VLNYTACAQAAAGMLLEGYGTIPGTDPKAKLTAVLSYVQQGSYSDRGAFTAHAGFTVADQLPNLVQAAKNFGIPITNAAWKHTTDATWVADLRNEVQTLRRPTIVLLPDLNPIWPKMPHVGHYIVVSGISADGRIIEHDAWDGNVHLVDQATFRNAWDGQTSVGTTYSSPYLYLDVTASGPLVSAPGQAIPPSPSTSPSAHKAATKPGGMWISPADGSQQVNSIQLSAHAYPSKASDPAIDHVSFTVWWPALGARSGPWKTACTVKSPTSGDEYDCDFNPGDLGAPAGQLWLSFDVYDTAGDSNLSPNGERSVDWMEADDVIGDGWQTYQGDGYTVDYPGEAVTIPAQSNGIYTVSASYYYTGSKSDPDAVYLVERITFPSGYLSLYGSDFTPYLKQTLSSYAGYSRGAISSPQDITVDGRPGLEITSQGTDGAYADGEIVIVGDDMYMIVAGCYPARASVDTATFFASFHLD
jgi:hypothetical protein